MKAFDGASGHALLAWREWEVELVDGSKRLLDRVDALIHTVAVSPAQAPFTFGLLYGLEEWHAAALEEQFRQLWDALGPTLRHVVD